MQDFDIRLESPGPEVVELARAHRAWAAEHSPPEDVHAVEAEALAAPTVTLVAARSGDGALLGMGALRDLDGEHAELKAMHVRTAARGHGVGRAIVLRLVELARRDGYRRVSLETGTMEAFAAARRLYASIGFRPCPPFGEYTASPNSICMTMSLMDPPGDAGTA